MKVSKWIIEEEFEEEPEDWWDEEEWWEEEDWIDEEW